MKSGNYYADSHIFGLGAKIATRWIDVAQIADFRSTDHVLDMGCAEGSISFEVAKLVMQVQGVEIKSYRVECARRQAAQRKVKNVVFTVGSVVEYPLPEQTYDVVLYLGVMGKGDLGAQTDLRNLERLLLATRRQIIIRVNVQSGHAKFLPLLSIIEAMNQHGFDAICFSRIGPIGNLIVGNRRGTDARLRTVPPLVLVPTEHMRDHSCLRGAQIGSFGDFA
ncbi:MAG: class I SAM-dependent methyltransferase [Candidatus Binatia bacterium]